jgi:hypothetical protein
VPSSGTVTVTVVPHLDNFDEWWFPSYATIQLTDIAFVPEDDPMGDEVVLEQLLWEELDVGWFPG